MLNKSKIESGVKTIADNSDEPKYNFNLSTKANDIKVDKTGIYHFKPSGIGDSWLIGTDVYSDSKDRANAFTNGTKGCPPELTIPSTLTDENGQTKKVEIIGQYAFYPCAYKTFDGQTRKLTLTKQVKIIKYRGLGGMDDLEEFVIEEGSVLEIIEQYGLRDIGYSTGQAEGNRGTLTLPLTLSSVFEDGIYQCNLFDVIIYCGRNPLSNTSTLESSSTNDTVVKVLTQYPSEQNIFGRSPDRNSQADVHEKCMKMALLSESIRCPVTHKFPSIVLHILLLLSNNKEEELHLFAQTQVRVVIERCEEGQATEGNLIACGYKRNKLKQAPVVRWKINQHVR